MKKFNRVYDFSIISLAIVSISFVVLDFASIINISSSPCVEIDNVILVIFSIDYFVRFFKTPNKWLFFNQNIFDLIAIIPFSTFFSIFRISRIFRIARLTKLARLSRLVGVTGKLQKKISRFLNINGFIYLIYISIFLLALSSILYSIAENVSLGSAFWWALATTTTVGYGDISPTTPLGRLAAVILMFLGIGIIGMLTSTITGYFTKEGNSENEIEKIHAFAT